MNMDTGEAQRGGRSGGRYPSNRGRGRGDQYYSGGGRGYSGQQDYYNGGGRGGGYQNQGYNQSYGNFNQGGYRGNNRGGGYWGRGRGSRGGGGRSTGGRGRGGGVRDRLPDDVEALSELKGHTKKITCVVLDESSGQLFTGSHDRTVRVWSCTSGECISTVQIGGEVDSMLIEGGFLFVGNKTVSGQGLIKVWNMATNQDLTLEGHIGRVQCLAAAGGMLFSGGQDQTIRVWKVNPATGTFECAAVLQQEHNGHSSSISSLCASGPFLFSGDAEGNIKVWDLAGGAVRQTLERAHTEASHPAIMALLVWEGHLVTGSLDGYIKVWEPADPALGLVINGTPVFAFPEQQQQVQQSYGSGGRSGRGRGRGGAPASELPGVLALCGVADAAGKSVLMAAYNGDTSIRLLELPTFAERGTLPDVHNVRAMAGFAPGRLMMSGDEHGRIKVWRWKDAPAAIGFPGA